MSIQSALEQIGITEEEYNNILKIRKCIAKGNSCEVKKYHKENKIVVYEVRKEIK